MHSTTEITLNHIIQSGIKLTPMMEQYAEIKAQYPGMLLMFRMGDFYELFFEDAKAASKILNISLTHRGKLGDFPIPMAGIPHHAAAAYIDRITGHGHKVAICEQVEDPKEAKGIVKRAVTQVCSPGMPFDMDKSEARENRFMASAIALPEGGIYLALLDYTTGDFLGLALQDSGELLEKLLNYAPKELLVFHDQWAHDSLLTDFLSGNNILVTHLPQDLFNYQNTKLYIEKLIPAFEKDQVLKLHKDIYGPIGALCYYITSTQSIENAGHIKPFRMISQTDQMKITYPTLVGLEIFPKSRSTYTDSILGFMDATKTSMGARQLKVQFQNPMRNQAALKARYDWLDYLIGNSQVLENLRNILAEVRDLERVMAKVTTGKVNGQDLINIHRGFTSYQSAMELLKDYTRKGLVALTQQEQKQLEQLSQLIATTINDEIGATLEKGNLIKQGADAKRDKLAKLTTNATESLTELEQRYREETGIPNLKIKYNNLAGYFIEVSKSHTNKVPKDFIRRQTLVNSERYQNQEIADFEKEMLSAKDKLLRLEREIFDSVVAQVKEISILVLKLAHILGQLDTLQSLAYVSAQNDFVRPELHPDKKILNVQGAWHPIIKSKLKDRFVSHNLQLDEEVYFGLITGPNMAGKTTVMREMAIIQFLSQVGCFVPARQAQVGLCDYIFSRLGAHDDIIRGQSTFMVEMSETAEILRHATGSSLIILDEIGRGTSTYDGLSIAWSLVEYFHTTTKAMTLFSTHYHELIQLVDDLPHAKNLTVKTVGQNGQVEFLYELIEGGAAQSFGIHVAKLAGLPAKVLKRATAILKDLEEGNVEHTQVSKAEDSNQLDMFSPLIMPQPSLQDDQMLKLLEQLKQMDLMNMTPIQVVQRVHEIQRGLLH